jgi:hypothetical protein
MVIVRVCNCNSAAMPSIQSWLLVWREVNLASETPREMLVLVGEGGGFSRG